MRTPPIKSIARDMGVDRFMPMLSSSRNETACAWCNMFACRQGGVHVCAQVHLVEIDIAEDSEIAEAAGVAGTPTVQMFKDKARIYHLPGVKNKREYRELISSSVKEMQG